MPMLGLGVYQIPDGEPTANAVRWALEAGYRHIDTAQGYGNEAGVGRGLRESGVPRDEVFITTKFNPGADDPEREAEASLERLGVDRLDLYLVHYPQGGPHRAWPGMQRALERGLTAAIGVSNFDVRELEAVVAKHDVPPAVNQIQLSPFQYRRRLLDACERLGIVAEAYSPLTRAADLDDPTVLAVAERNGRTPAQVLLRWGLQRNLVVIPKSTRRERIEENARIFDFELSPADMKALDALDRTGGTDAALENDWWSFSARAKRAAKRILRL